MGLSTDDDGTKRLDDHCEMGRRLQRADPRTDSQLLRAARREPAAFGELYARHVGAVHAWQSRRAPRDSADLTAETFAQAWLSRRAFRDDKDGSALPWLLGIARNVLRESVRHDRVETKARERLGVTLALDRHDDNGHGGDHFDGTGGYNGIIARLSPDPALKDALEQLPEHERVALELRVIHELPYREIACTLAIRPAAARLRVSRALRRLSIALIEAQEET